MSATSGQEWQWVSHSAPKPNRCYTQSELCIVLMLSRKQKIHKQESETTYIQESRTTSVLRDCDFSNLTLVLFTMLQQHRFLHCSWSRPDTLDLRAFALVFLNRKLPYFYTSVMFLFQWSIIHSYPPWKKQLQALSVSCLSLSPT